MYAVVAWLTECGEVVIEAPSARSGEYQVQLEVKDRDSVSVIRFAERAAEYFSRALRKHCAARACVVIKLVLRVRANRT
jgi:hypothetical protein